MEGASLRPPHGVLLTPEASPPQLLFPQQESTEGGRELSAEGCAGTLSLALRLLDAGRAAALARVVGVQQDLTPRARRALQTHPNAESVPL